MIDENLCYINFKYFCDLGLFLQAVPTQVAIFQHHYLAFLMEIKVCLLEIEKGLAQVAMVGRKLQQNPVALVSFKNFVLLM